MGQHAKYRGEARPSRICRCFTLRLLVVHLGRREDMREVTEIGAFLLATLAKLQNPRVTFFGSKKKKN